MNKFASLLFLVCAGCATSYQKDGFSGGYSEMKLAENVYKVTFRGNGYTSSERVGNYFLRRCAEITKQTGNKFFVLNDDKAILDQKIHQSPGSSQTSSTINPTYTGGYQYNSTTNYTPPTSTVISKHMREGVLVMFPEGKQPVGAMNAEIVLSNFSD